MSKRHRPILRQGSRWWMLTALAALSLGQICAPLPDDNGALPAENARAAFASQCALNVITCTTSFPHPVVFVEAGPDQTVTQTDAGFLVTGSDGDGAELVRLIGSDSGIGNGATQIFYSWSFGAADDDPQTLEPGEEFSTEADPQVLMAVGLHYIRLTVRNDNLIDALDGEPAFDFEEVEIEVRD